MTPRPEIVMLREGTTLKEFLSIHDKHAHSRFPVYKEDGDDIVGTVSVKDIVKTMATEQVSMNKSLESALRPTLFVPESKLVGDLFEEMRRKGVQLAIVVNEYGGVAGLATLKELLEEIVGPVGEEGQTPEEEFETIDQYTFQVEGGMAIDEANTELNLGLPKGDYDTVAGFALSILGHIPAVAETFVSEGLRFEIAEMRGLKIGQIKITHQLEEASSDGTEKSDGASSGRHGRQDI
jgi:putative hemolysin